MSCARKAHGESWRGWLRDLRRTGEQRKRQGAGADRELGHDARWGWAGHHCGGLMDGNGAEGCPSFSCASGKDLVRASLTLATMSVNSAVAASIERRCASVGGIEDDSTAAVRSNTRPMPDTMLLPLAR